MFKSHRILRKFKNTFYKEIIINHTLLCLSQVSYIKIKAFWLLWGSSTGFCENPVQFYQISLKILVYLTDFSPQFMACMYTCISIFKSCLYEVKGKMNAFFQPFIS